MADLHINGISTDPSVCIRVKPGEPVPDGYVSIPEVRFKQAPNGAVGMPMTPAAYRGLTDVKVKRLSHMGQGKFGAVAHVECADGRIRPMCILDAEDAQDPMLNGLTAKERKTILNYLKT